MTLDAHERMLGKESGAGIPFRSWVTRGRDRMPDKTGEWDRRQGEHSTHQEGTGRTCSRCWVAMHVRVDLVKYAPRVNELTGQRSRIFSYWRCPKCRCIW